MRGINGANPIQIASPPLNQPHPSAPKQLAKMALLRGKKIKNQVPYSESKEGGSFTMQSCQARHIFLDQGNPDDAPTNSP